MESHARKHDVIATRRTLLDRAIARLGSPSRPVRLVYHILTILTVAGISTGIVHLAVRDDRPVAMLLGTLMLVQNLLVYYGMAHWVLPKLIYKRRTGWFTAVFVSALVFWGGFLINRAAIFSVEPTLPAALRYVGRIRNIIGPTGLLGCFVSMRVFLWNSVFMTSAAIIPLFFKTMFRTVAFRQKQFDLKLNRLLMDRDNTLLTMNFLKAQVSPHFLFNTLNSIYARVLGVDDQAADRVLQLAELMRYNLYEANATRVTLGQEVDYLRSYIALEKARHGDRLKVEFNPPTVESAYLIAPLLLITYIENAFKHSTRSDGDGAYILIDMQLVADTLHVVVENSLKQKQTLTTISARRSGGVGLPNVRKRLDLQYPDRYVLTPTVTDAYYRVALQIKLETATIKAPFDQTSAR